MPSAGIVGEFFTLSPDSQGALQRISLPRLGDGRTQIGRVSPSAMPFDEPSEKAVAVLLPSSEIYRFAPFEKTANIISQLHDRGISFRLIPEAFLTVQWDGLDFLIVEPSGITSAGKRMLQGFCAAGGTVVALGTRLGLRQELLFSEWLNC